MWILKTASSPMMLDHLYRFPDETASKDTRIGYKHVLHLFQSGVFNNWCKRKASNEVP